MDGRGSIKELFPTGKQLEPLVAPLADGKVAVGQDDLTVVLNEEGVCTQKCALNWTDIPIAMGKKEAQQLILWSDSTLSYVLGVSTFCNQFVDIQFLVAHAVIFEEQVTTYPVQVQLLWLLMSSLELTCIRYQ